MNTELLVCDLQAALVRMGSNVELAKEMLQLFREDAPVYQSQLSQALASGDATGVQHASHSLRGMLSMFGAAAAMQAAERLEQMAVDRDLAEARAQHEILDDEISRFLTVATTNLEKL